MTSHQESGAWHCEPDSESRVAAQFKPGVITLDGQADDWDDIYGFDFPLLPALDPDQDKAYNGGKMTIKVCFFDFDFSSTHILGWLAIFSFKINFFFVGVCVCVWVGGWSLLNLNQHVFLIMYYRLCMMGRICTSCCKLMVTMCTQKG